MAQRWYQKATVQSGMIKAVEVIVVTLISVSATILVHGSELRSDNKTLAGDLQKTKEALRKVESDNKTFSRDLKATEEALRKAEADNKTVSRYLKETEEALRNAETDMKAFSRDLTMKNEELRKYETNYNTVCRDLENTKEDLRNAEAPIALDPNLLSRIDKVLETYEKFKAMLERNFLENVQHATTGVTIVGGDYEKRADYTLRLMETGNQQTQSTIRELRALLGIAPKKSEKSGDS